VCMHVCSIPRVVPIIGPYGYMCAHEAVLRACEGIVANLLDLPTSSYKQPESSPFDTETSTDLLKTEWVARWYYTTRIGGCTRIRVLG
jgi:hypothetical protein